MLKNKLDTHLSAREYHNLRVRYISEIFLLIITILSFVGGLALLFLFHAPTSGIPFLSAAAVAFVCYMIVRKGRPKLGVGIIVIFVELLDIAIILLYRGTPDFGFVTYTFLLAGLLLSVVSNLLINRVIGLITATFTMTLWIITVLLFNDSILIDRIPTTFLFFGAIVTFNYISGRINGTILRKSLDESEKHHQLSDELSGILERITSLGDESARAQDSVSGNMNIIDNTLRYYFEQVDQLDSASNQMSTGIGSVKNDLTTLLQTIEEINQETQSQSSLVEQNAAAQTEAVASISKISENIENANSINAQLEKNAIEGKTRLDHVGDAVRKMKEYQSSINAIISTISGVAAQTNLLAMNASIEAAHAGDAGRGFAVVALEIRTLADTTNSQVKDIKQKIKEMNDVISSTSLATEEAGQQMQNITQDVSRSFPLIQEITAAMKEQGQANQEMIQGTQSLVDISGRIKEKTSIEQTIAENFQKVFEVFSQSINQVAGFVEVLAQKNSESKETLENIESVQEQISDFSQSITELLHSKK